MSEETNRAAWEKLDITKDELNRLGKALQNEEFRKLLVEYAEEINDPANKKIYEEEIKQLEKERGVECTFINPEPGYVIKTSIDGTKKAFINVCKNENIGKPTSMPSTSKTGSRGLTWSLPYSQVPPREDLDKKSARCTVFDVVFHPDTHRLAKNNPQFKNMMNDTAMDAVETNFHVKLDRKNVRFPKMSFKGSSRPSVIRKKSFEPYAESKPLAESDALDYPPEFKYPFEEKGPITPKVIPKKFKEAAKSENKEVDSPFTTPHHTIKYRSSVDIQDCANDRDAKINAAIPKELVVSIFLPLLKTTADVTLDVTEKWIQLKSEKTAKYFLHLSLPYSVDDTMGNAKFAQKERKLVITLPVKRTNKTVADLTRDDSGVESDAGLHLLESDDSEENECKHDPKIQVVSESVSDEPERTKVLPNVSNVNQTTFLNPDIHYSPTAFTCNVLDDMMAFTLHVKNVEPDSVRFVCTSRDSIHVCFSSVGAGFFPLNYAFYMKLPSGFTFIEDKVSIEAWDNNVILQLNLNPCEEMLTEYYAGNDSETAIKQDLPEPAAIGQKLALTETSNGFVDMKVQVSKSTEEEIVVEISRQEDIEVESSDDSASHVLPPKVHGPRKMMQGDSEKTRCISESSSEELGSSYTKKGILKCRSVSRSLSESNADDFSCSSSLDAFPQSSFDSDLCIPEELTEEEITAKKTARVRFNDFISKKFFRSNSSILGQRIKNERKARNKKRAQERRASESENSEVDTEREKRKDSVEKGSTSSGSGDDLAYHTESAASETPPNQGIVITNPLVTQQSQAKHSNKCKKKNGNKSKQQKHDSMNIKQLGFKNDFIFDLDM